MRKRAWTFIMAYTAAMVLALAPGAGAVTLWDWSFRVDETLYESQAGIYDSSILPSSFDYSGFNWGTGLGTITVDFAAPGPHGFLAFFDHEFDEPINTYFNEYGDAVNLGLKPANLSWEIDEPGYTTGNLYANFLAGSLDGTNAVPASSVDDVAMALGWVFTLNPGESAVLTLAVTDIMPSGGFYLEHTDPDSLSSIFFSSTLNILGSQQVPEPMTLVLMGAGMAGFAAFGRRRKVES